MIEKKSKRKTSHHKFFFDPLAPKVESHHPSYDDQKDDVEVKKAKRCSPNGRTCRNLCNQTTFIIGDVINTESDTLCL